MSKNTDEEYYTISEYLTLQSIVPIFTREELSRIGKRAMAISRDQNIPVKIRSHPKWNNVNTYHKGVLDQLWGDTQTPNTKTIENSKGVKFMSNEREPKSIQETVGEVARLLLEALGQQPQEVKEEEKYHAISEYCNLLKITLTEDQMKLLGRKSALFSKAKDVPIKVVSDSRFGSVHCYRRDILDHSMVESQLVGKTAKAKSVKEEVPNKEEAPTVPDYKVTVEALQKILEKQEARNKEESLYSIPEFIRLQGIPLSRQSTLRMGQIAKRIATTNSIAIGTVEMPQGCTLNTYPENVLFNALGVLRGLTEGCSRCNDLRGFIEKLNELDEAIKQEETPTDSDDAEESEEDEYDIDEDSFEILYDVLDDMGFLNVLSFESSDFSEGESEKDLKIAYDIEFLPEHIGSVFTLFSYLSQSLPDEFGMFFALPYNVEGSVTNGHIGVTLLIVAKDSEREYTVEEFHTIGEHLLDAGEHYLDIVENYYDAQNEEDEAETETQE